MNELSWQEALARPRTHAAAALWTRVQQQFAARIVAAAYHGLLGRAPDPEGEARYTEHLRSERDLAALLAALAESDECWQRQFEARAPQLLHDWMAGLYGDAPPDPALHAEALARWRSDGMAAAARQLRASPQLWQQLLDSHAEELVQLVFRSVLGRAAEPEALATYLPRVGSLDALESTIADIVQANETWQRLFGERKAQLIDAVCDAVLGRAAHADEHAQWSAALAEPADMPALLQSLLQGDEYRARQFGASGLPAQLVDAVYRGLLERPADARGLQHYAPRVHGAADVATLIAGLRASPEYQSRHARPAPAMSALQAQVGRIEQLYGRYLQRAPAAAEVAQLLQQETPPWQIEQALRRTPRPRTGPLRVLLFGAYGNGNMGDAYQALAVRAHLLQLFGEQPLEVSACSLLDSSDYLFPAQAQLPPQAIWDAELVNGFDYLIIGGGGLLAHPHDPLADPAWCRSITVPTLLLAVGAAPQLVAQHAALLEQAVHVTGRDTVSVDALAALRPDVGYAPDPILALGTLAPLLPAPAPAMLGQVDVLWVLKYAADGHDEALLDAIRVYIQRSSHMRHLIVGIEPALDGVLEARFPGVPFVLTERLEVLAGMLEQARQVFSMRYHGAIFALLAGRSVVCASQPKLRALAVSLGAPAAYLEQPAAIGADMWLAPLQASPDQLQALGADFQRALQACALVPA